MDEPLRTLRADELRRYREDGVILARGLFPEVWIERMARAIDAAVERPSPFGRAVSVAENPVQLTSASGQSSADLTTGRPDSATILPPGLVRLRPGARAGAVRAGHREVPGREDGLGHGAGGGAAVR